MGRASLLSPTGRGFDSRPPRIPSGFSWLFFPARHKNTHTEHADTSTLCPACYLRLGSSTITCDNHELSTKPTPSGAAHAGVVTYLYVLLSTWR